MATTKIKRTQLDNVQEGLSGASLTAATVATDDKVLIQDTSDSNNLKTVTTQDIASLAGASPTFIKDDFLTGIYTVANTLNQTAFPNPRGIGELGWALQAPTGVTPSLDANAHGVLNLLHTSALTESFIILNRGETVPSGQGHLYAVTNDVTYLYRVNFTTSSFDWNVSSAKIGIMNYLNFDGAFNPYAAIDFVVSGNTVKGRVKYSTTSNLTASLLTPDSNYHVLKCRVVGKVAYFSVDGGAESSISFTSYNNTIVTQTGLDPCVSVQRGAATSVTLKVDYFAMKITNDTRTNLTI